MNEFVELRSCTLI